MGWWNTAIMGGDTPMDFFGRFCDVAHVNYIGGNPEVLTREALNEALPEIVRRLHAMAKVEKEWLQKAGGPPNAEADTIGFQVLGVTIMERGADMPQELREMIIAGAEQDGWMREVGLDSERGGKIEAFIKKIRAYVPGKAVNCSDEHGRSLIDTLYKTGMIRGK